MAAMSGYFMMMVGGLIGSGFRKHRKLHAIFIASNQSRKFYRMKIPKGALGTVKKHSCFPASRR
jgi:hypothetical protein